MPSTKDPTLVVNPGPGRLPAGVVPAGALLFPPGGGSGAALAAHISDPVDAHMAHAIGIDPIYPPTNQPLLTSVGGVVDGESVLDFIAQFKDLIPPSPNTLGLNQPLGVNSGIPSWGLLGAFGVGAGTGRTGGFAKVANTIFSHYLVPTGTATFALSGMVFPADRGVLAFYKNTDGNFFNSGATTLVSALWLGQTPSPAGVPNAAFNDLLRNGQQTNYTGAGSGIDFFNLTFRLPYLKSYAPYGGAPYSDYDINFASFQLATFSLASQAISTGDAGSYLLVHWKPGYATTLAAIQPANLTIGNLVAANCFSSVPVAGDFDDSAQGISTVNRHFVFRDTDSGSAPVGSLFTSAQNGTPTTSPLSGVAFYNNGGTPLAWTVDVRATGLFANSFQTGTVASPPVIPTGFTSAANPMTVGFSQFGGTTLGIPYSGLRKATVPGNYSNVNAPLIADVAQYINASLSIASPSSASPAGGFGLLEMQLRDPFNTVVSYMDTVRYLFNSFPQSGGGTASTETFETFVDEKYRYVTPFDPTPSSSVPIVPAGGNIFASATPLVATGPDLQVVGGSVAYPQVDFSAASYRPAAQPNYATVLAGDASNHIRRYLRAFNTGIARNIGKLRIRGLAFAAFDSSGAYTGAEVADHPGGAIIQIKVPGGSGTGWLDIGRVKGDPDLTTSNFRGCRTGLVTSGPDLILSFDTTSYTVDNGSGKFLLFVRVSFFKGAGTSREITEMEWQAP